jgi:hypothetical protein
MNNDFNTARAPKIKHDSPEVKDVCYFAERVRPVVYHNTIIYYSKI